MQASNVTIGLARSRQRERQAAASFQAITMASAGLVLDEDFDVIHAIDPRNDDDKSDEEDFERASDEAAAMAAASRGLRPSSCTTRGAWSSPSC